MKFVEKCFVFADDVVELRNKERCAAVTYQSIEKHLFQGHIHFSFLIKKNCKEPLNVNAPNENTKRDCTKPKAAAYSMPNKGSLKGNNVRKGQSIPDVKASGGGVLKKEVVAVVIEDTKGKGQPPDYSSINRVQNNIPNPTTSPAHCTEALKRNDDDLVGTNLTFTLEHRKISPISLLLQIQLSTTKTDALYHIPGTMCQNYKSPDHKIYRQKYPTSCLSKPILRK